MICLKINNIKAKAKETLEENEKLQKIVNNALEDRTIIETKSEENKKLQECISTMTKEKTVLEKKVVHFFSS